jgi:Icc-related predicted phosphoesterase
MLSEFLVFGYACVPPTPFLLKDWERYDVSRYVDPDCLSPEEGMHSVPVPDSDLRNTTIKADLEHLVGKDDLSNAIFLFHSPPYQTNLDRAALDGKMVDHVPLDLNVGSIAVRRFIETSQPLLTLHGHVHESARITGLWKDKIGRTYAFSAAHDGPELALVRFRLDDLEASTRELI